MNEPNPYAVPCAESRDATVVPTARTAEVEPPRFRIMAVLVGVLVGLGA